MALHADRAWLFPVAFLLPPFTAITGSSAPQARAWSRAGSRHDKSVRLFLLSPVKPCGSFRSALEGFARVIDVRRFSARALRRSN